jgi:hypothetical protein
MTLHDLRASVADAIAACSALPASDPAVRSAPFAADWLEGGNVWDRTAGKLVPEDGAVSHLTAALQCIDAAMAAVDDFERHVGRAAE